MGQSPKPSVTYKVRRTDAPPEYAWLHRRAPGASWGPHTSDCRVFITFDGAVRACRDFEKSNHGGIPSPWQCDDTTAINHLEIVEFVEQRTIPYGHLDLATG